MRDQYAGDVSDVLKIAFLRALTGTDRVLGVAWYYSPGDDGRPDGRHLEWRSEPAWQRLNSEVHAGLSTLPERSIAALERAAIWPSGTMFHREAMPTTSGRAAWGERKRAFLRGADIVFLDPDNGLGGETVKHATISEVKSLRRKGRVVIFITFPGRHRPHDEIVKALHHRVSQEAAADSVITLRTNVSVSRGIGLGSYVQRQRWFTVVDPDDETRARAQRFADDLSSVPRVRATIV